ncbi:MAG TPA: hypothetical protein VG890_09015, partial [Puia sp.]|nr:hypothetical protein [Puia sp.]
MRPEKLFIILVLILATRGTTFAQNPSSSKAWQFHSINQVGLLEGESGSSWQLQTVNGMSYKSWFAGIGVGLDYYRLRGIPLFLDLRKTFGHSRNKPFVYADG